MKNFLIVLAFSFFSSCFQNSVIDTIEPNSNFRSSIEERDSIFILYTIKEWGKKDWYTFQDYSRLYHLNNDQVYYFIEAVFYSPDKTKMLSWIGEKVPNARTIKTYNSSDDNVNLICPNGYDTIFNLTALIGIRDSIKEPWRLFPFNQQQATCFHKRKEAINVLYQYYFHEMKSHKMYRIQQSGERKGYKELEAYGYNLNEKEFWSSCWLWHKDTVGSRGLYPFQIKGYDYKGEKCDSNCAEPYDIPKLNYPKEILSMYEHN